MKSGVVYCYTNRENGKKYIGQTIRKERKRKNDHKYGAFVRNQPNPFQCDIRKYGWDYFLETYEVLERCEAETKEELLIKLNERERYYIEKFNTLVPDGYNVFKGTSIVKRKYKHKEEASKKLSEKLKGRVCYPEGQRKVMNYDTKEIFVSVSEAGRQYGIHHQSIYQSCVGKINKAGGHKWCYVNDDGTIDDRYVNRGNLQYHKYIYCEELDMAFNSLYKVSKFLGKHYSNIKKDLKQEVISKRKVFGYTWRYITEEEYNNHVNLVLNKENDVKSND